MKTLAVAILALAAFCTGASAQTVEIPLRLTLLRPPGQPPHPIYSMPVRIGSKLVETGVDTGSIGLRVLPNTLGPDDARAGEQPETYGYGSGVELDGVVGTARLGFGERAAEGRLHLVRAVACFSEKPHCPATRGAGAGALRARGARHSRRGFQGDRGPAVHAAAAPKPQNPMSVVSNFINNSILFF